MLQSFAERRRRKRSPSPAAQKNNAASGASSFTQLSTSNTAGTWQLPPINDQQIHKRTSVLSCDPVFAVRKYLSNEIPATLRPYSSEWTAFEQAQDELFVRQFDVSHAQALTALTELKRHRFTFSPVVCALIRKFQYENRFDFMSIIAKDWLPAKALVASTAIGMKLLRGIHSREVEESACFYDVWGKPYGDHLIGPKTFAASLERGDEASALALLELNLFRDDAWWHTSCLAAAIRFESLNLVRKIFDKRDEAVWTWSSIELDISRLVSSLEDTQFGNLDIFACCMDHFPTTIWEIPLYSWRGLEAIASFIGSERDLSFVPTEAAERLVVDHVLGIPERFLDAEAFVRVLSLLNVDINSYEEEILTEVAQKEPREMEKPLLEYLKAGGRPYIRHEDVGDAVNELVEELLDTFS
ncbi:hypothetical protein HKX48_005834 [Thoreauomyces humboldtii]|nr:hypothetical protein HKX48_005834 [Thoreauomyces humboldtii]